MNHAAVLQNGTVFHSSPDETGPPYPYITFLKKRLRFFQTRFFMLLHKAIPVYSIGFTHLHSMFGSSLFVCSFLPPVSPLWVNSKKWARLELLPRAHDPTVTVGSYALGNSSRQIQQLDSTTPEVPVKRERQPTRKPYQLPSRFFPMEKPERLLDHSLTSTTLAVRHWLRWSPAWDRPCPGSTGENRPLQRVPWWGPLHGSRWGSHRPLNWRSRTNVSVDLMHQSHEQRRVRKYAHARPAPDPIIVGIARSFTGLHTFT